MEVGQSNKEINVGFVIQARMKSTRLPGKVLLPLPFVGGKPLIQLIVDKLNTSVYHHRTVVATSKLKYNDVLVSYCEQHGIEYFRGSEDNVFSRFISIVKRDDYDVVVRLTADNPIIDIIYLDKLIEFHLIHQNDYTNTDFLPIGMNLEVFSPNAFLCLQNLSLTEFEREHVTPYLIKNGSNKRFIFHSDLKEKMNDIRVTVDYPSDYIVVSAIVEISLKSGFWGIELINYVKDNFPWLLEINSSNFQKRHFTSLEDEISNGIEILNRFDLKRVSEILEKH